jgi:hypothetical protein
MSKAKVEQPDNNERQSSYAFEAFDKFIARHLVDGHEVRLLLVIKLEHCDSSRPIKTGRTRLHSVVVFCSIAALPVDDILQWPALQIANQVLAE